jgi:hypothetical protein
MSIDVLMIIEESNSFSSIQKIERAQDTMIDHDVMLYFIFLIERYKQRQYAIDKFDQAILFVDDIWINRNEEFEWCREDRANRFNE